MRMRQTDRRSICDMTALYYYSLVPVPRPLPVFFYDTQRATLKHWEKLGDEASGIILYNIANVGPKIRLIASLVRLSEDIKQ